MLIYSLYNIKYHNKDDAFPLQRMETNGRQEENAMKKYFGILAAALALCLSIAFVPAASITSERPESLPTGQTPVVRQISVSRKTEEMVWVPTHGGEKYHKNPLAAV